MSEMARSLRAALPKRGRERWRPRRKLAYASSGAAPSGQPEDKAADVENVQKEEVRCTLKRPRDFSAPVDGRGAPVARLI